MGRSVEDAERGCVYSPGRVDSVTRDVKASGIRLRLTDSGSGPPIVLLHTTFLDRTSWDRCVELLAPNFRVIAPDLPGFGESEKPARGRFAYGVDDFVHVVTDLFAGLNLGQATVVGHGLGGAIALALASRSPELVSRLVLVDALCYPVRPDIARRLVGLPLLGSFVFKQLVGRTLFATYLRETLTAKHRALPTERIHHYYETFNTPSARESTLSTLLATADPRTVEVRLSQITVPTLVVWGRHDAIYPAAFGQRLAREVRGAGFRLMNTGHTPPEEDPEELSRNLARFCSG